MTLTIVATVGLSTSNSFVTEAEAVSYLAGRLNATAYTEEGDTAVTRAALVEATRELSSLTWQGSRVTDTQALAWPRQWVTNPDSSSSYSYFASTVIPQRVKDACVELALEFLKSGTTDLAALPSTDAVIRKTVDVLTTEYASPSMRRRGVARFPRVQRLISPLLAGAGSNSAEVIRG